MQGGADQTINAPSSLAPSNTHWCQTCNRSQGGTIKIEARTETLSVVLRLNDRTLLDQSGSLSMAHICLQPCLSNSVNVANN